MTAAVIVNASFPRSEPDGISYREREILAVTLDGPDLARAFARETKGLPKLTDRGEFHPGGNLAARVVTLDEYAELTKSPDLVKRVTETKAAQLKAARESEKQRKADEAQRVKGAAAAERQRLITERAAEIEREREAKIRADALKQAQKEIDAIKTGEN